MDVAVRAQDGCADIVPPAPIETDLGQQDGVVPGNVFVIFRYVYPNAPRKVLGELAVLTVQPGHATARIMESKDFVKVGDLIELK